MAVSLEQARKVVSDLLKSDFLTKAPFTSYLDPYHIRISQRKHLESNPSDSERNDYCVVVGYRKQLPSIISLPDEIDGVKIYTELNTVFWLSRKLSEILNIKDKTLKIRKILEYMIGEENVDPWLNAPYPDLGNRTPKSVMDEDEHGIECVHDMLMRALSGQPT